MMPNSGCQNLQGCFRKKNGWMQIFQKTRFVSYIITAPNVLSPPVFNEMYKMYLKSKEFGGLGRDLDSLCVKIGDSCLVNSILELWYFNETTIRNLNFKEILTKVQSNITYSPMYGTEFNMEYILGGIRYDARGKIHGADSVTMLWVLENRAENEKYALAWEKYMIDMANSPHPYIYKTYVYATRTFDDEGYGAVNADISLLTAGFIIVFIFIIVVLGRFNLVEHKFYVSLAGILSICLAILFCYGIAMAFGFIYGPIHSLMPFLLLGIGVDDMFVIVESWRNLTAEEKKRTLEEKIALSLRHSGVSITVTSITDIVAFGIGGSTVIPALRAFCAYAALGILGLYLLVSTFFVAVLTLDCRRVEQTRDGVLCFVIYKNFRPNTCSQKDIVATIIERFYAPVLMKNVSKVLVILVTLTVAGINLWSFTQLRQDFDLYNYIPSDSYATDYIKAKKHLYPNRGYDAAVYCDEMDYFENRDKLTLMAAEMNRDPYIEKNSAKFWFLAFENFLKTTNNTYITYQVGPNRQPTSSEVYYQMLLYFLKQKEGRFYGKYIKFTDTLPYRIKASYIPFFHVRQTSSAGDIQAMESIRNLLDHIHFHRGHCFSYGFKYLNNETNKVLKGELYRNLALAAACVFVVTLILIANLWTSLIVFTCVFFTVVDVVGTLQFWGVTIDTASSILIILCVGLAVDYSAHVGHTFMTIPGNKEERARKTLSTIGPAVLNGGFSTFLAFVLLADSKSFGFVMFFRVFMSVVLFGLFHGLVYLPVVLSLVGPSPYESSTKDTFDSPEALEMLPQPKQVQTNGDMI